MAAKHPFTCPFCNFEDSDSDFLIQHVDAIHPENGEHSFGGRESPRYHSNVVQKMEGANDVSPDYVECLCGEFCLLADFDSHLEMHYAEGMGFEEIEKTTDDVAGHQSTTHRGKAASPVMDETGPRASASRLADPLTDIINGPSIRLPIRPHVKQHHSPERRRKTKDEVSGYEVVTRLSAFSLAESPRKSRRHREAQRLGVSMSFDSFATASS